MKQFLAIAVLAWWVPASAQPSIPTEGANSSRERGDWEREQESRNWQEGDFKLPAPPRSGDLVEFFVSAGSSFQFFIDAASLSYGADGVMRYTLVARSPSGTDNVSYEGMRCSDATYKVYALGQGSGWALVKGAWKTIEPKSVQRWHQALRREYFCPFNTAVKSAAEALEYLRRGGHPDFRRNY